MDADHLSDLLHNLDATSYFFVSSALFVALIAGIYFLLGFWLGNIVWGRYKKRHRVAEVTLESLKNEIALLKRRIAEANTRSVVLAPSTHGGPSTAGSTSTSSQSGTSLLRGGAGLPPTSLPLMEGHPFTLWTQSAPELDEVEEAEPVGAVVQQPPVVGMGEALGVGATVDVAQAAAGLPASRAFTIWTEAAPAVVAAAVARPGRIADFLPALTLTSSTPVAEAILFPAAPVAASAPMAIFPVSQAFSVWTEEGWVAPGPVSAGDVAIGGTTSASLPRSLAFTVWTEEGWERVGAVAPTVVEGPAASVKGPVTLPPSAAFTLWTQKDFVSAVVLATVKKGKGRGKAVAAAAVAVPDAVEEGPAGAAVSSSPEAEGLSPAPSVAQGFGSMGRALAAARSAPLPQKAADEGETEGTAGLPMSRAFTLWTVVEAQGEGAEAEREQEKEQEQEQDFEGVKGKGGLVTEAPLVAGGKSGASGNSGGNRPETPMIPGLLAPMNVEPLPVVPTEERGWLRTQ